MKIWILEFEYKKGSRRLMVGAYSNKNMALEIKRNSELQIKKFSEESYLLTEWDLCNTQLPESKSNRGSEVAIEGHMHRSNEGSSD